MAEAGNQLLKLTECCICLKEFTDPRMLPCIHTFCLGCLKQTHSQTSVGGSGSEMKTMPCPLCRQVFPIPAEGFGGLQKNFFMEHLMEIAKSLKLNDTLAISCDICKVLYQGNEQTKTARKRCLECSDNFCDLCSKAHTLHKSSKTHHIVTIGSETEEDMRRISSGRNCSFHNQKPLDYYCPSCKQIFCVSCVLENHAAHNCKDVSTVDDEFRKVIERIVSKISIYADEVFPKSMSVEMKKDNILSKLAKTESEILQRQSKLKEMIDKHTTTLLTELSSLKHRHIKDCESEKEEIECRHTILKSFETYCTELRSKGSASDICACIDNLIKRENELEKDHEEFIGRPCSMIEVSFVAGNISMGNVVGQIQERPTQVENCVIITGLFDGRSLTNDVLKLNLHHSQITTSPQFSIPTMMQHGAFAAVYSNTLYVTGIGNHCDEIWKFNLPFNWMKCTSLVQGRSFHSAAFTDGVLYICGGSARLDERALDSVEAFSEVSKKCYTVGKLIHCVTCLRNCVPFQSSLYIFGGLHKDNMALDYVQMYDTRMNQCTLLSKPMPFGHDWMQAILLPCQTSVVLLGHSTCYIFNLETGTWQERKRFKTGVSNFGLVLENERIFLLGGGVTETDKSGNDSWKCRDDVVYVPLQSVIDDKAVEWKLYTRLGRPTVVQTYGTLAHYT